MKTSKQIEHIISQYLSTFSIWEFFRNKTILITGSKGTVGTALMMLLLSANERFDLGLRIVGSTRNPSLIPPFIEQRDPVLWIRHGEEESSLLEESIDFIIHAACPTNRNAFRDQPVETFLTILHDTERMLCLARKKGVTGFLYLSSDAEYGSVNMEESIDESFFGPLDPLNTRSCYPLGKKASVFLCRSFKEEFNVPAKIIRFSIITGLFQPYEDSKAMSYFLRCLAEGKNIVLNTSGLSKKQVVFSMDAAMACLFVLERGQNGEVYNVTNADTYMAIKDYAERLTAKFGAPDSKVDYLPVDDKTAGFAKPSQLEMKIDKIVSLGWRPLFGLDDIFEIDLRRIKSHETD